MKVQNLNKKKKNNHSSDGRKIRLLRGSGITKTTSDKHVGEQAVEEEIRTLKQQMEFILGVTKTGLDIIDSEFNIRYIDPQWAKTYGDHTGRKCYEYFMGGSAPCPGCGIPKALKTKKPIMTEEILMKENCRPIQVTTIPFRGSNGEWLVAEVNADISERKRIEEALLKAHEELEMRVQERTAQLALANEAMQLEITERKQAEEALITSGEETKRLAQENAIMAEIGRIISSTLNIEEVYDRFAQEVYKLIPFDGIAVNMINHAEGTVTVPYVSGMRVPGYQPGDVFPLAGSVTGEVARNRSGLIIRTEDREELRNRFPTVLSAFDAGLRSVISVPLISKDQVIGTIHFRSTKPNAYSDQNLKLAESVASQIAGAIASAQLFSEHKRTEERLRESEDKYRTILENIEDAYYEVDLGGNFKFFNDSLSRMLGYSRDELMGMNDRVYTDQENAKKMYEAYHQVYLTGKSMKAFDWEVIRKDGRKGIGEVSISLMKDSEGRPCGFRGIARDVTERKRVEKALRDSEDKFRNLVETASDWIWETDAHGNYSYASPKVHDLLGYSPDEVVGRKPFDFMPPGEAQRLEAEFTHISKERRPFFNLENANLRKDGNQVILETSGVPRIDSRGNFLGYRGIDRDITERKQAEGALRESEERYRTILENIEDAYFEVDLGGNFTFFNNALCKILGYTKDERMGMNNRQYTDQGTAQRIFQEYKKLYITGKPLKTIDYKIIRKDGLTRFLECVSSLIRNERGERIGFRGVARDVTDRKESEEALRQSEERYRTLVEESFDGIFIQKGPKIIFANQRLYEMLGYDEGELLGRDHWLIYHPDYHELTRERGRARMLGENVPSQYEVKLQRRDGSSFDGEINARRIMLGSEAGIQVWVRDITKRKQSEGLLLAEKKRFQTLSEQAPFGLVMIDKDGTFKYVNPKFRELFGYDLTDVPDGKTWFRKAYPNPAYRHRVISQWMKDLEGLARGEKIPKIFTATCKDGTEKIVNLISIQLGTGEYLIAYEDITERTRAEGALRESEKKYRELTDFLPEIIFETDEHGKLLFANRCAFETYGYSRDDFDKGLTIFQMVTPESRETVKVDLQELFKGERSITNEYTALRKDGSIFPALASANLIVRDGNPVGVRGIAMNISERKQMEEALQESEKKFRVLTETAASGIFIHRGEKFIYVNPASCAMSGYSRDELLQMNFWDIIHPDFREMVRQRAQTRQHGAPVPSRYELKILTKKGEERWIDLTVGMIDFEGKPAILGTDFDITERKHAEEEMRALEEQLLQSQKMEAVGRLAGGIAHDFNNLLTVIKGYSQLSLLDLKESHPLWGNIQEIEKATQKATDLTRQLLAFSRRQILDPKVLDLNTLLRDLEKMLCRIIGEDIELSIQLTNDLGRVKIDPGQFEQMILNLAVNAKDAMPSGGKLSIETSNVELDGEYASNHVGVTAGHYVRLSVSDDGVGMSKEVKEKMFEPFFTTKEKGKGTGLGLSTVYGIVKQSGGNIWAYSEPGHGTTLKIHLPVVEEALDILYGRDETESLPGGSETVLLVEDEQEVRSLAYRLLRQQGYKVLVAANGIEALHIAREHSGEKIDLLLTDVVMPQMSGRELADRLKTLRPDVRILYTSGYTDDAIVHHGLLDPGTHFLQKPFSHKDLSHKVREVLDRSIRMWSKG